MRAMVLCLTIGCATHPSSRDAPVDIADTGQDEEMDGRCGALPVLVEAGRDGRRVCASLTGATIEVYPDAEPLVVQQIEQALLNLSAAPSFAPVLADTTILVSSPGATLAQLPDLDGPIYAGLDWAQIEGLAMYWGLDGAGYAPTLAIRHDSVERWDLGIGHELLHLILWDLEPSVRAEALALRNAMLAPDGVVAPGANEHELFTYFSQWTLAGYGSIIAEQEPELYDWLIETLGEASLTDRGTSTAEAEYAIDLLLNWFRTGAFQR
ncbi:MAG: hypothetical protein AAFV53_00160 [Myxococcota bacterium]